MRINGLTVKYIILVIAQILLWNFCNFTQFLMVVYLPALILFLPIRQSVFKTMMVAFLTGVVVDFFSVSPIGLTSLALVPVAFSRQYVVWLVFGNEVYSRAENLSVERQGWRKVVFSILLVTLLFLLIYIAVDSAGTRPFWIDVVKGAVSLAVAVPLSFYIVSTLSSEGGSSNTDCPAVLYSGHRRQIQDRRLQQFYGLFGNLSSARSDL